MKFDNLNDLQILVQTARTGSLTAASQALKITPAAASAMLKRLESQTGIRLFERSTRSLRLTKQGETLLHYATQAFELLSEGAAQLHSEQTAISGPIRITAPGDLVRSCLLPWIDDFLRENPAVTISVFAHDAVLDLMKSEIDIALRYGELEDSSSASRRLAIAQLTVCAAPQYLRRSPSIKKPQDLAQHNCLTFFRDGRPDRVWNFSRQGRKEKVNVNGDRFLDDASLAREWAVQGAGIILLSSLNVRGDILAGRLVPVLKDWDAGDYPLNAVMPSSKYRPKRIEVFLNYLIQKFAEKRPTSS